MKIALIAEKTNNYDLKYYAMNTLKTKFRMNGLPYTLLKRNDKVALFGIGGDCSPEIRQWEVDKIYIRKDKYVEREGIATNEQVGRDLIRCFMNEEKALKYFDELTTRLNLLQGVQKTLSGVQENAEIMILVQQAVNAQP
jgi:hypothetical protein